MMNNNKNRWLARWRAREFNFCFNFLTVLIAPLFLVAEKFLEIHDRATMWRGLFIIINKYSLALGGISTPTRQTEHAIFPHPVIYAANTMSPLDARVLQSTIGLKSNILTPPTENLPPFLRFWLKKTQAISVSDNNESISAAIEKMVGELSNENSVIVFPENSATGLTILDYFHSGAAEKNFNCHAPIIPVTLKNSDAVMPDTKHLFPGIITITFEEELQGESQVPSKKLFDAERLQTLRDELEKRIVPHLPTRNIPRYFIHHQKKPATFLNIDNLLYENNSESNLIRHLMTHRLDSREAEDVMYWLILEKLKHPGFAHSDKPSHLALRGWKTEDIREVVPRSFTKQPTAHSHGLYQAINQHQDQSDVIIILSEARHPLTKEFNRRFMNRAALDHEFHTDHNCYAGDAECQCYKEDKARLVKQFADRAGIDLAASYIYTDSFTDAPLISLIGHHIVVNPDEQLRDYAEQHQTPIIIHLD
jgi:phosphoserine phosphatase/1-acyl-sn-glycerol-3-phosphate acyltransferase